MNRLELKELNKQILLGLISKENNVEVNLATVEIS